MSVLRLLSASPLGLYAQLSGELHSNHRAAGRKLLLNLSQAAHRSRLRLK
jgi:hypothetical protein